MSGFSLYFCVGRYGGWRFVKDGPALRITLGWVGVAILFFDLERYVGGVHRILSEQNRTVAEQAKVISELKAGRATEQEAGVSGGPMPGVVLTK